MSNRWGRGAAAAATPAVTPLLTDRPTASADEKAPRSLARSLPRSFFRSFGLPSTGKCMSDAIKSGGDAQLRTHASERTDADGRTT